jgi:hypothetical protein
MPCVQAKERQQREAHIRANRRDVDPYDGIDDPLALLKLVHSPPKPDPLIRYLPPPRKPATLYAELDSGQIAAMVRHAHSLLKKGDIHKAQDIAACLLAFVSADISSLLQELIRVEELRPEFLFHRAAPKIRNLLTQHLARVAGHDRLLTDKLLSALAWVGDERVVELFAGWRAQPPSWASDLHIPAHQYAREAGWELSSDGQRRNLYHEICYPLIRSDAATSASPVTVLTDANLFELDGTSEVLAFLGRRQPIVVPITEANLVGGLPRRSLILANTPRSPMARGHGLVANAVFADRRASDVGAGCRVPDVWRLQPDHAVHRPDFLRGHRAASRRDLLRFPLFRLRNDGVNLSADLSCRRRLCRPLGLRRVRP